MSLIRHLAAALEAYDQEDDDRHSAVITLLTQIKDEVMALRPEVQALHDSVDAMKTAIASITTDFDTLEQQVADLKAALAAAQQAHDGDGISAEDLAEIANATQAITASVQKIKDTMPAPIEQPVIDAAAAASEAPPANPEPA